MKRTNASRSNTIALSSVAILLVIILGAVAHTKLGLIAPRDQIDTFDHANVMHSDLYWSPLEECSNLGLIEASNCRQVHIPSYQSSIDRAEESATLNSKSHSDQSSADAPQVSEKPSTTKFYSHFQDQTTQLKSVVP